VTCTGGGVGTLTFTVAGDRITGRYFFIGPVRCLALDQGRLDLARR
jgi:hypothetical protein